MCAVSAVSDYYQNTWPNRFPNNPNPFQQLQQPYQGLGGLDPNADLRRDMATVLRLLDSIDKRLGDIECMDEEKTKFLAQFNGIEDNLGEEQSG
jgi:hypothetical protein